MASAIEQLGLLLSVSEVEKIVITENVSTEQGSTRSIRIYGQPQGTNGPAILEIRVSADEPAKLLIPAQTVSF